MQRSLTSLCTRCRLSIFGPTTQADKWLQKTASTGPYITKRFRSGIDGSNTTTAKYSNAHRTAGVYKRFNSRDKDGRWSRSRSGFNNFDDMEPEDTAYRGPSPYQQTSLARQKQNEEARFPKIEYDGIPAFFQKNVTKWANDPTTLSRMHAFGFPADVARPLLEAFTEAVQSGALSDPASIEKYHLTRLTQPLDASSLPMIYSTTLFHWSATNDPSFLEASHGVRPSTIKQMQRLAEAADRSYPAELWPIARTVRRKVIMHVGPTNSGKTHHALRALAAAKSGVYAGPLRLLAHEIWERLNMGQIVPAGMDAEAFSDSAPTTPDPNSAFDGLPAQVPAVRKLGNPRFARECNMLTGEEQKIVSSTCRLLSCTIEMLAYSSPVDVAVIDEIQMIADPQRGSAWTNAILGLCAAELHLCGEETAVPLVRELLRDTGDELIVNRYERLTPLVVEEESLEGDWSRVKKGDCIVTFRRSNIFAIKREVEEKTGMRCAVVYGKLPPEIRSEQAALFNDPNSGYDVIIGSDAIGMGLNLKIRRVIFEAVAKMENAGRFKHLSASSVKQIAGRAGRFGMHGDGEAGGYTTTFHAADLQFLRDTLPIPFVPLPYARLGVDSASFRTLAAVLPANASTATVIDAHMYISRAPPAYRFAINPVMEQMGAFIDTRGKDLTVNDRTLLLNAPIAWRDQRFLSVVDVLMKLYAWKMHVRLKEYIAGTTFRRTLGDVERMMKLGTEPWSSSDVLDSLETFHKTVVLYIWLSFRNSVVYSDYEEAAELKHRIEAALDWSLEGMSRQQAMRQGAKRVDRDAWKAQRKDETVHFGTALDMKKKFLERKAVRQGLKLEEGAQQQVVRAAAASSG